MLVVFESIPEGLLIASASFLIWTMNRYMHSHKSVWASIKQLKLCNNGWKVFIGDEKVLVEQTLKAESLTQCLAFNNRLRGEVSRGAQPFWDGATWPVHFNAGYLTFCIFPFPALADHGCLGYQWMDCSYSVWQWLGVPTYSEYCDLLATRILPLLC